jgi:hypothetical protein
VTTCKEGAGVWHYHAACRYEEGPDGEPVKVATRPEKPKREVFAKEQALLRELGLR